MVAITHVLRNISGSAIHTLRIIFSKLPYQCRIRHDHEGIWEMNRGIRILTHPAEHDARKERVTSTIINGVMSFIVGRAGESILDKPMK